MYDELMLAQEQCNAWRSAFESIEAHLQDRIAMKDYANPERYLDIVRGEVREIQRTSEQFCAARSNDAKLAREKYDALHKLASEMAEAAKSQGDLSIQQCGCELCKIIEKWEAFNAQQ